MNLTVKRAVAFIWNTSTGKTMTRIATVVAAIDNHLPPGRWHVHTPSPNFRKCAHA